MDTMLVYVDSICWEDLNNKDIVTNVKNLDKNAYIEVEKGDIDDYDVYLSVKKALWESTKIDPWYFNMEYVCEV